jgi:trehalose/maltose hydrolase-like predicted phosphorylase
MEVLDMFENKVVKISDQILSTYLFYLVFFKEKLRKSFSFLPCITDHASSTAGFIIILISSKLKVLSIG